MSELSSKQEAFCRNIAEGMSQCDAYRKAGYKVTTDGAAYVNASRLLRNDKIAQRVQNLKFQAAKSTEVTLSWLIQQAQDVLAGAVENNAYGAAVAAIKELGVLTGQRVEKRANFNRSVDDLDESELLDLARSGCAGTAKSPVRTPESDQLH